MRGYPFLRMHTVDWSVVAHAGLAASERERDARAQATARHNLGTAYHALERLDDALTIHLTRGRPDQALAIHAETGHRLGQAQAHLVTARAAHAAGDHAEAGTRQSEANALFAELGVDPEAQRTAILDTDPA